MECIEKEAADDSLPTEKLVGLTTEGASVMVSARGRLYGKLNEFKAVFDPLSPSTSYSGLESWPESTPR